jgi:hypothetical protein
VARAPQIPEDPTGGGGSGRDKWWCNEKILAIASLLTAIATLVSALKGNGGPA